MRASPVSRSMEKRCIITLISRHPQPPRHVRKVSKAEVGPTRSPRKPWPRRSTSWTSTTSVAGAILVNAPTLGKWYLFQGAAVAISRATGIYALLISGLSRRKDERFEIGVTRIECSRTKYQRECEKHGDGKRPLATFHGPASLGRKTRRVSGQVTTLKASGGEFDRWWPCIRWISHMGQSQPNRAVRTTSAFPPIATDLRTSREVRVVPQPDSCSAAKNHVARLWKLDAAGEA